MTDKTSREPQLSKKDETAPMLAKRNIKGLGARQREFLTWLSQNIDDQSEVSYLEAWVWMKERLGYYFSSRAESRRMSPYVSRGLYSLLRTLVGRGLIWVYEGKTVKHHRRIRLLCDWPHNT